MNGLTRLERGTVNASPGLTKFYKDEIQLERFDCGSFGEIYIVKRMPGFGKVVVKGFKELANVAAQRLETLEQRELEFVLKLSHHPNILSFYGYLYEKASPEKRIGFVTEFMANGSLHTVIYNMNIPYEEKHVLNWALQAARGLRFCHANELVHRDVKPQNMLLSNEGTILKLCDFGLSRERAEQSTANVGSVMYMAPEVMSGGSYDYKCDVYSLALTIWEMYHRRLPAVTNNPLAYQQHIQRGVRPKFGESPVQIGQDMPGFIEGSWETEPAERTEMSDVLNFLESKCAAFEIEEI